MRRTLLKTIISFLSLLAVACQGAGGKGHPVGGSPALDGRQDTARTGPENTSDGRRVTDSQGLEIPAGRTGAPSILLFREGYTASYNVETRTPNWVAWHLKAAHTDGPVRRKGIAFHADEEVPEPRADTYDYILSGYDRGHMCPAGDNHWSRKAMEQSFLMTNVCPQDRALNSGLWNTIEKLCRAWAQEYGDVYIVCGSIYFRQRHRTIGSSRVQVPEAFFKVVLCMQGKPKAIGFICRNVSAKGHKKTDYVNSVDEVERITGLDFFPRLPDDLERHVERKTDLAEWRE